MAVARCWARRDLFAAMVGTVISQQISTKAARSIQQRLFRTRLCDHWSYAVGVGSLARAPSVLAACRCQSSGRSRRLPAPFSTASSSRDGCGQLSNEEIAELLLPIMDRSVVGGHGADVRTRPARCVAGRRLWLTGGRQKALRAAGPSPTPEKLRKSPSRGDRTAASRLVLVAESGAGGGQGVVISEVTCCNRVDR